MRAQFRKTTAVELPVRDHLDVLEKVLTATAEHLSRGKKDGDALVEALTKDDGLWRITAYRIYTVLEN